MKVLRLEEVADLKSLELFERQFSVLRSLQHPGLPRVYELLHETRGGRHRRYMRQELIRGESLADRIAAGYRYDEQAIRKLLDSLLDILDYLHRLSPPILHRDIKPSNIMIRSDGSPVLIDFDTARGLGVDHAMADGTMVGSAGYVPTEQLAGRPVPASDLYALGMTIISALSHRRASDLPTSRMRVQFRSLVNVSEALVQTLEKMVEPAVEDRFQSVAEVRQALRAPFVPHVEKVPPALPPAPAKPEAPEVERYRRLAQLGQELGEDTLLFEEPAELQHLSEMTVSDDGETIFCSPERGALEALEASTLSLLPELSISGGMAHEIVLSADGAVALKGPHRDYELQHLLGPHAGKTCAINPQDAPKFWDVRGIALRPDGEMVAVLSHSTGYLFDATTGALRHEFELTDMGLHFLTSGKMRFSPDGSALIFSMGASGVVVLDASGKEHHHPFRALAISRDGQWAAIAENDSVKVGPLERLAPLNWARRPQPVWKSSSNIEMLRFSAGGHRLVAVDRDHRVVVVDVGSGEILAHVTQPHLPHAPMDSVETVGFLRGDDIICVHGEMHPYPGGNPEKTTAFFSVSEGRPLGTLGWVERELTTAERTQLGHLAGFTRRYTPVGITTAGSVALLAAGDLHSSRVRRQLLGEPLEHSLTGRELQAAQELKHRIYAWTRAVADDQVLATALVDAINGSAGRAHWVPAAIHRARSHHTQGPARFGDTTRSGALPADRVLAEVDAIAQLSPSERAALFEGSLERIARHEQERRQKGVAPRSGRRFNPLLASIALGGVGIISLLALGVDGQAAFWGGVALATLPLAIVAYVDSRRRGDR